MPRAILEKFRQILAKSLAKVWQHLAKTRQNLANFQQTSARSSAILNKQIESRDWCKGMHCVDLGESFPTSIYLQNLASIQPLRYLQFLRIVRFTSSYNPLGSKNTFSSFLRVFSEARHLPFPSIFGC